MWIVEWDFIFHVKMDRLHHMLVGDSAISELPRGEEIRTEIIKLAEATSDSVVTTLVQALK